MLMKPWIKVVTGLPQQKMSENDWSNMPVGTDELDLAEELLCRQLLLPPDPFQRSRKGEWRWFSAHPPLQSLSLSPFFLSLSLSLHTLSIPLSHYSPSLSFFPPFASQKIDGAVKMTSAVGREGGIEGGGGPFLRGRHCTGFASLVFPLRHWVYSRKKRHLSVRDPVPHLQGVWRSTCFSTPPYLWHGLTDQAHISHVEQAKA